MSVDVALWDPETNGLPKNYKEATAIYLKLSDGEKTTSNSKLIKFASMFDVQLNDSELDQDLRQCYENIQRYAKQNQQALYTVGLPDSGSIDALKQIVESAQATGMVVFYDMMGAVFLPNGLVFPEDKAEMWHGALAHLETPPDFPSTLKGFEKIANPLFAAMAERHGMKKIKLPFDEDTIGYVREVELGQQYIKWRFEGRGGEYKVSLVIYINSDQIDAIYKKFLFKYDGMISISIPNGLSRAIIDKYAEKTNKFKEITSHEALRNALDFLEYYVFVEILDIAHDINGLDEIFNYRVVTAPLYYKTVGRGFYSPHSLILACLARNPRFDSMIIAYEAALDWGANREAKVTELPKLLDYLRNEVKPIV